MAYKKAKSLKFPGLPDTYTIPQVADGVSGNAAVLDGNGNVGDSGISTTKIAQTDGAYAQMNVGTADNLVDKSGAGAQQEIVFRPTAGTRSIERASAEIKSIYGKTLVWNQLVDSDTTAVTIDTGHIYIAVIDGTDSRIISGTTVSVTGGTDNVFDLTRMFGAGNEPSTVEEFRALFPLSYYSYDPGSLLNFKGTGIKTVGFNQWDEEIVPNQSINASGITFTKAGYYRSKNFIPVIGGMYYHCCLKPTPTVGQKTMAVQAYDSRKTLIRAYDGITSTNKDILLDENAAYIRFYTNQGVDDPKYENNVTINLAWSGYRNGEYEPYWTETKNLPIATYFPDGMKSAGTVRDELTRDKAIKRIAKLTLAIDDMNNSENYPGWKSSGIRAIIGGDRNIMTGNPYVTNSYLISVNTIGNEDVCFLAKGTYGLTQTEWKTQHAGEVLELDIALSEPIETPIDPPLNFVYRVDDFGTEMLLPENDDEPTTTPLNASIYYGINYAREVINLGTRVDEIEEASSAITGITAAGAPLTPVDGVVEIRPIRRTMDSVAVAGVRYYLGTQSAVTITMPTDALVGQEIAVFFKSGSTATTLVCDLDGFSLVPAANKSYRLTFELVHKADPDVSGDEDEWTCKVEEG